MKLRLALAACLLGVCLAPPARAAVVIVANRSKADVRFTVQPTDGKVQDYQVVSGDLVAIPVAARVELRFSAAKEERKYQLNPNSAYFFADFPSGLNLEEIGFRVKENDTPYQPASEARDTKATPGKEAEVGKLPVKILVDQNEPTQQRIWEARLRERLKTASDILEKHCRMRMEVVAVDTWQSDGRATTLAEAMADFERKVDPHPARLAIGYTSQFRDLAVKEGDHLGGTRRPLHSHILIREWLPPTEPEQLEVLVHELGHYFGAAHSPESGSVMRPKLGDRQAIVRQFRIGFDPPNTLAMYLIAEEVRTRQVRRLTDLSSAVKDRLRAIYSEVGRAMPDDPVFPEILRLLREEPVAAAELSPRNKELADAARRVMAAIGEAAGQNRRLPERAVGGKGPFRLEGDELTQRYFRAAATAAQQLPKEQAAPAYLLALGVALDDSNLLRSNPVSGGLVRRVETDEERERRLKSLGAPTMRGRRDLAQHFVVSSTLTALYGAKAAEAAGLLKEQLDARSGSGFSFADLCADLAGIAFAGRLLAGETTLAQVADTFAVNDYLPELKGLKEGLSPEAFAKAYGSASDERFKAEWEAMQKRIRELPGYKK
jgi:hypothetical protein